MGLILGLVGTFVATVVSIATKIGPVIAATAKALAPILKAIPPILEAVSCVAEVFLQKPEAEKPEEIGLKAEEAAKNGVVPENFESTKEYIEYLRNEITIDEKKLDEMSEVERQAYATVGTGFYVEDMNERFGVQIEPDFWRGAHIVAFSAIEIGKLIEHMNKNGLTDTSAFSDFIKGNLPAGCDAQREVYAALHDMYHEVYPDMSEDDISEKIWNVIETACESETN